MTHYCDAGNQPRFVGTISPDGKTITFDFIGATNLLSSQMGHMQHVVFTLIDAIITLKGGNSQRRMANRWVDCWTSGAPSDAASAAMYR